MQQSLTQKIKQQAKLLGFQNCGIAKAEELTEEARLLEAWLNQNYQGEMAYMANHFDKRIDPRKLVDGAKSVISLSYNYFTEKRQADPEAPIISTYAFGEDYHEVVKGKLAQLLSFLKQEVGDVYARCFVDSAPVMEKAWAKRAGVGWIGKHTNLLTKGTGSFFFLAEIICDVALEYDSPVKDFCGNCTKCIDACPTNAIFAPYQLDASKCISYFTIELKHHIDLPDTLSDQFENRMYGCDICQDVCPINARAKPHSEPLFEPKEELLYMSKNDWQQLSEDAFKKLFKNSAVKRTKYHGLMRNIKFVSERNSPK